MNRIQDLEKLLATPKKVVVIPHINPDGDALGSCLGWSEYLRLKGHQTTVVAPNSFPVFYNWMPNAHEIIIFNESPEKVERILEDTEVIFFLDYNDLKRIGDLRSLIEDHPAKFVMIDHHRQPTPFVDIMFSNHDKSSTCEMVFDVIDALGDKKMINKSIGDCIYTGIVTDTGSFRFGSTTKNTHYVAAHLLETGVKPDEIYTQVFDTNPIQKIQLLGFVLAEKLNQLNESQAAYISLSLDEQNRYSFEKGDDEGFVNYGLAIKGVKLAGYFREGQDEVKVSLRSKGDFDVNVLAREHFNGGGHRNAAGGSLKMSLEQAIVHFNKVVRLHEDALKIK